MHDNRDQKLRFSKTLTTYPDPTLGIYNGIKKIEELYGVVLDEIEYIIHGTTLITNAVIERKGSKTAFITTKGFEDVLEIGRELRYDIYDLFLTMPKALVPRNLRFGVEERVSNKGEILTPLSPQGLHEISQKIIENKVEAVGVCLLNSFANARHEKIIGQHLQEKCPDVQFSLSSEIMPEIREYERSSATAMNAYVQPLTDKYLKKLEIELKEKGFGGKLLIMDSGGKLTTVQEARKSPIQLLESGPAGGAIAGVYFSKTLDIKNLLCFDMGGTTAKASIIFDGKPEITNNFEAGRVKRFKKGSGLPVRIPVIDMIEIGAGGGSIARADQLGLLVVGPDSASSTPGPACYGRGGDNPTVTDADLVLGYLDPEYFLGGTMNISVEKSRDALREKLSIPLDISIEEAAMGIHRVVNENMANAARVHILEKGMDPRHFSMIAFGGAGPVHAFGVAKLLNVKELVIPIGAGVTSAVGFLLAPIAKECIHSHIRNLESLDWDEVNNFLERLEEEGKQFLVESGEDDKAYHLKRVVDMRYEGQGHDITIELPEDKLDTKSIDEIKKRFIKEYNFRYNRSNDDIALQMVTWRVLVSGKMPDVVVKQNQKDKRGIDPLKKVREVYFDVTGYMKCPVYDRYHLATGFSARGPMIIEEKESTTVVGLNSEVYIDNDKNIVIHIE